MPSKPLLVQRNTSSIWRFAFLTSMRFAMPKNLQPSRLWPSLSPPLPCRRRHHCRPMLSLLLPSLSSLPLLLLSPPPPFLLLPHLVDCCLFLPPLLTPPHRCCRCRCHCHRWARCRRRCRRRRCPHCRHRCRRQRQHCCCRHCLCSRQFNAAA